MYSLLESSHLKTIRYLLLIKAYLSYRHRNGHPNVQCHPQLNAPQKQIMLTAYESKAQYCDLDWINHLYDLGLDYCPMCGSSSSRSIEHYLPKSIYPEFSVFSYNLVPSCTYCNTKRNNSNTNHNLPYLHPYFDEELLSKLKLKIEISIEQGTEEFKLTFNKEAYCSHDRDRISRHLEQNVDEKLFKSTCRGNFTKLKASYIVKNSDYNKFRKEKLEDDLKTLLQTGVINDWYSALIRGALEIPQDIFESHAKASFKG